MSKKKTGPLRCCQAVTWYARSWCGCGSTQVLLWIDKLAPTFFKVTINNSQVPPSKKRMFSSYVAAYWNYTPNVWGLGHPHNGRGCHLRPSKKVDKAFFMTVWAHFTFVEGNQLIDNSCWEKTGFSFLTNRRNRSFDWVPLSISERGWRIFETRNCCIKHIPLKIIHAWTRSPQNSRHTTCEPVTTFYPTDHIYLSRKAHIDNEFIVVV